MSHEGGRWFELIEFLRFGVAAVRINRIFATRLRAAPQFDVGLRRRNNEFNELTNCWAARVRGIAPERGAYSRIGACPYLPPQLINSRCCPCKGRISWAGLAPQHLSRYEPLTGARFINRLQEVGASPYPKYEPPSGALAPHFIIRHSASTKFVNSFNSLFRRLSPRFYFAVAPYLTNKYLAPPSESKSGPR